MLTEMDSTIFDWIKWRNGSPIDLGIQCRYNDIINNKHEIKQHAIGYCDGEKLKCRPKINNKVVMFYINNIHFWFHMRNNEFERVFCDD